nr:XF1762 family protein [Streptacidiphilus neutrinimicus]
MGRPVARHLDDGQTLEVTRTCSDGVRNANSLLLGAAWRAARALGYTRLVTYTQAEESGASLRAAGWRVVARRPPRPGWHTPSRPREVSGSEHVARTLWEAPS